MAISGIDTGRIEAMVAQLKMAAARAQGGESPLQTEQAAPPSGFANALKSSLDQVNRMQHQSEQLGKNFALGDDKVGLSDVMISMQKANIAFQETIQVRNKLVAAYHEIMNMQV